MGVTGAIMGFQMATSAIEADGQKAMGKYQQRISKINAERAEMQAEDALKRGGIEAKRYGDKVTGMVSSQKVALAAQGIDISGGSAAELINQTQMFGTEDVQTIRNNAFREALGYRQQASDYIGQGNMARASANNQASMTLINGGLSALSTGLSSGALKGGGTRSVSSPTGTTGETRIGSRRSADFERGGMR